MMPAAAEIHRAFVDGWNQRDFNRLQGLLHPDYTYTGPDGAELKGPEAGLAVAKSYADAIPDGKLELRRVYVQGDTSIAELVARGTHKGDLMGIPPSGKSIEITICNIMEVRDGKVCREREYFDMMTLMTQIGAVKPPARTAGA